MPGLRALGRRVFSLSEQPLAIAPNLFGALRDLRGLAPFFMVFPVLKARRVTTSLSNEGRRAWKICLHSQIAGYFLNAEIHPL